MRLATDVRRDHVAGTTVVRLGGRLDLAATGELRTLINKCLAETPVAVVVDLAALTIIDSLALAVFSACAAAQRRVGPSVTMVLCDGQPFLAARRAQVTLGRGVLVAATLREGLDEAATIHQNMQRMREELPYALDAPDRARRLVNRACIMWQLEPIREAAQLIVSELATNAVRHGQSTGSMELLLREPYLHIRVSDRNPAPPVRPPVGGVPAERAGGRGLWLVDLTSSGWGWVLRPDGKTVWATVRMRAVAD